MPSCIKTGYAGSIMEGPNVSIAFIKMRFDSLMASFISYRNITSSLASFVNNLSLSTTLSWHSKCLRLLSINLGTELLASTALVSWSSSYAFLFEGNTGSDRLSARNSSSSALELVGTYPLELSCCTSFSLAGDTITDRDDFDMLMMYNY